MTGNDQPPQAVEWSVEIDTSPAGRHANDQILANVTADLDRHLTSLRRSWANGEHDRTDFTAGWATALQLAGSDMPSERLASLLAVAMCRLLWQETDP